MDGERQFKAMRCHDLGVLVGLALVGGPHSIPASWGLQMGWCRSPCGGRLRVNVGISVAGGICRRELQMGSEVQW